MIQDRRTDQERKTHTVLIVGTDPMMSGWGEAKGMASYAAWAVNPVTHSVERVFDAVNSRSDMRRVRVVVDSPDAPYRPGPSVHLSIYVVDGSHPYGK